MSHTAPPQYLSSTSADALISDLRPTSLQPLALAHLNALLDELLLCLLRASQSINPVHLRREGVPAVFSASGDKESTGLRALARSAVGEAELELRSWHEGKEGSGKGFPPGGQGRGMTSGKEKQGAEFPLAAAVELLRWKCVSFSTLAPQEPLDPKIEEQILKAWKSAGGDTSDDTIAPAALWITAILEHVCEHILAQLGRVVARDSSIATAGVQDLYVALCEDESVWGFFKRLKVKDSLEAAIRASSKPARRAPSRNSPGVYRKGVASSASSSSLTSPARRDASFDSTQHSVKLSSPPSAFGDRASSDTSRIRNSPSALIRRKGEDSASVIHERSPSVLSQNTRSIIGAFHEQLDSEGLNVREGARSPQEEDEEEFDALVRSGETMKVSLTPSRLKTFETTGTKVSGSAPTSPQQANFARRARGSSNAESTRSGRIGEPPVPPLIPRSSNMDMKAPKPTRPVEGLRSRSSSQQKLQARGPTIIDEQATESESEVPGITGATRRKESLLEILASEPIADPIDANGRRKDSSPTKRTVPAVVLGTPPPPGPAGRMPAASGSAHSTPPGSVLKSSTEPNDADRDLGMDTDATPRSAPRKKSEAQELADFFANTPPPPPAPERFDDLPPMPTSAKSQRGFKRLLNRVTGRKKGATDEMSGSVSYGSGLDMLSAGVDQAARSNTIRATEQAQANLAMARARRQKSMNSFAGGASVMSESTRGGGRAELDKEDEERQPLPPPPPPAHKGALLRKKSVKGMAAGGDGGAGAGLGLDGRTNGQIDSVVVKSNGHGPVLGDPVHLVQPSTRNPSQIGSVVRSDTARTVVADRPVRPAGGEDVTPSAALEQYASTSGGSAAPGKSPSMHSDGDGFETADEGESSMREVEAPVEKGGEAAEADGEDSTKGNKRGSSAPTIVAPALEAAPDVPPPPPPSPPSIPLTSLVPLRTLLQHATTATECQLLLDAVLSQLGVPAGPAHAEGDTAVQGPEERVAAWLIAGGSGPHWQDVERLQGEGGRKEDLQRTSVLSDVTTSTTTASGTDVLSETTDEDPEEGVKARGEVVRLGRVVDDLGGRVAPATTGTARS